MLDDDEEDFLIVKSMLTSLPHRQYLVDWVATFKEGLDAVEQGGHDAYLVDYRLGTAEGGTDFIKKAIERNGHQPFILLTGLDTLEIDLEAQAAGAADYVVKNLLRPSELDRSIRYSMAMAENLRKIRVLNAELESKVAERTRELSETILKLEQSQEDLQHSLEKEKELSELKSRFVSMASHEFRTPLTTINSSASLINSYLERNDPENIKKHVGRIQSVVGNLNGILSDFLSLGKLEEGRVEINPQPIDLPEIVREIIAETRHLLKPGQDFEYTHLGGTVARLDKNLFNNILINFLSNAVKYSPEGHTITVRTQIENGLTELRVTDHGIGIAEADQQKLFGRFFRASNVGDIKGTGLGLHIVRRHAELMGGQVGCDSRLGEGSTFWVRV